MQKTRRRRRPRKTYFLRNTDHVVASIYGLEAFADALGASYQMFYRLVRSAEGAALPFVRSYRGWEASCEEEALGAREGGFHQYWVYGVPQDSPPTEEQLASPPEFQRREKPPPNAPRMFQLVSPDRTLYLCLGLYAFCRGYGVSPANLSEVLGSDVERHSFSLRGEERTTRFVSSFTPYICPEDRTQKYKQRWKEVAEPNARWRKATVFDIRARVKEGRFRTVVFGHEFEGWPPPDAMRELKVTRQDIIPDWLLGIASGRALIGKSV